MGKRGTWFWVGLGGGTEFSRLQCESGAWEGEKTGEITSPADRTDLSDDAVELGGGD